MTCRGAHIWPCLMAAVMLYDSGSASQPSMGERDTCPSVTSRITTQPGLISKATKHHAQHWASWKSFHLSHGPDGVLLGDRQRDPLESWSADQWTGMSCFGRRNMKVLSQEEESNSVLLLVTKRSRIADYVLPACAWGVGDRPRCPIGHLGGRHAPYLRTLAGVWRFVWSRPATHDDRTDARIVRGSAFIMP